MRRQLRRICIVFFVFCVPQILLLVGLTSFSQKNDKKFDLVAPLLYDASRHEEDGIVGPLQSHDDAEVIVAPGLDVPDTEMADAKNVQDKYKVLPEDVTIYMMELKNKRYINTINNKMKWMKKSDQFKKVEDSLFNSSISSNSDSICTIPEIDVPKDLCPKRFAWKCNLVPTFTYNNGNGTIHVNCDGDFRVNTIDRTLIESKLSYEARPAEWKYYHGPTTIPFNTEYLDIACKTKSFRERDKHNYHTQFIPNKVVNMRQTKQLNELLKNENWQPLSILVISLDSLSRAHAHRTCGIPKTMNFLKVLKKENGNFRSFLFNRFNSIGKHTINNLTPLFSGQEFKNVDEDKRRQEVYPIDIKEWIWQYANKRGYLTSYGIDNTSGMMGTKTKCHDCHYRPPALPHWEHSWMARENEEVSPGVLSGFCEGDHFLHEHILNYTQRFLHEPHSAKWAAIDINAHHSFKAESINQVDEDLRNFLSNVLSDNGNLVVFLLGDHGKLYSKDYSHVGAMYETLLPFLSIIMPSWLLDMRPAILYNLLVNQQRYLTHKDLHLSMKSLLHYPNLDKVSGVVGENTVNVFTQEISRNRSCKHAGIPVWSCACGNIKKLEKSEWRVLHTEMAKYVIQFINQKHSKKVLFKVSRAHNKEWNPLLGTNCMDIKFEKMLNIHVREEVDDSGKFSTYYHLLFQAKEFKTVWFAILDNKWEIYQVYPISRYSQFSSCKDKFVQAAFCVCDVKKTKDKPK